MYLGAIHTMATHTTFKRRDLTYKNWTQALDLTNPLYNFIMLNMSTIFIRCICQQYMPTEFLYSPEISALAVMRSSNPSPQDSEQWTDVARFLETKRGVIKEKKCHTYITSKFS